MRIKRAFCVLGPFLACTLVAGIPPAPAPATEPPDALPTHARVEDVAVSARLWAVSFDSTVDLPVTAALAHVDDRRQPDAAGRTPTTGLAVQEKIEEFAIRSGEHVLRLKDGVLVSETQSGKPAAGSPPWTIVAAPRVLCNLGQSAEVSVGRPATYLERRDADCLVVREDPKLAEGCHIGLRPTKVLPRGVRFEGVTLRFSRIASRQPVPGVPLDVGRPVIDTRETSLDLTLDTGKVAIMPLPQNSSDPPLLVFLVAERATPPR